MQCPSCGTENRSGSRFCDECGAALATVCASCGAPNRADARFCAGCGAPGGIASTAASGTGARSAPPATATATAERRMVSVLFADLVGFTTFAQDRDPEAVRELLGRYFDRATEIVTLHGGTIEKFIGDAVMAVWGTPVAHEDDAERAVRAALEIVDAVAAQTPGVQARAAVLTGEAAVTVGATNQGMVAGDLVNTAARLQGIAEPGTVLVGEETMHAASRAIVFEPIGDSSLKGKTAPVAAWQAVRVVAARGGQGRADELEPPFVGRDEDLRALKEQLHQVGRDRKVRLLSITGPAGIGKSRLVWELEKYVDGVTERIRWHRGRSPSYGEGVTFWALGEMVRRRAGLVEDDDEPTTRRAIGAMLAEHVPESGDRELVEPALLTLLGIEPPPAGGRDALFPAWRLLFERIAEKDTTVLVFEDLQWADAGLLDFIDHILEWSKALPLMIVTLARPELFDRRPDWGAASRQLTAFALDPLTDEAMTELLAGLVPGLPESAVNSIVERAEGMPLYAVETVRALLADGRIERSGEVYRPTGDLTKLAVPSSLQSLIASRLDGLEAADRSLLQDAAVIGQVFSTDALAGVTGVPAADLEPRLRTLVRRQLLEMETDPRSPERGQYRFVQSLVREVAYGTLSRRDRRTRHLASARHYEALGDDELAGALASHYLAARDASEPGAEADALTAQARLALGGAAERAASLGAHDQALSYVEQALALTSEPRDRAPLLDRAAVSADSASLEEAARHAEAAVAAYRELGDPVATAAAVARLGRTLLNTAAVARATEVLEAAVPEAEALDDPEVLAETLASLSRAYMRVASSDKAIETADRALAIAERLNLEGIVAEAFVNKGSALHMLGRRRESVALQSAAVDMFRSLGMRVEEMRASNNLGAALQDDDPARANRLASEGMEVARQLGNRAMYTWLLGGLAGGVYDEGRGWDVHLEAVREALAGATRPFERAWLTIASGIFQLARGERVPEHLESVRELIPASADEHEQFLLRMTEADAALVSGDLDAAYGWALEAQGRHRQNPELPEILALTAATWARDLVRMRSVAARIAELPGTGAYMRAFRLHAQGLVDAMEDRPEAIASLGEARTRMLAMEQRFRAALFDVEAAIVLPGNPAVRAWAAESRRLLEELRARPYLERLDAALASAPEAEPTATGSADRAGTSSRVEA